MTKARAFGKLRAVEVKELTNMTVNQVLQAANDHESTAYKWYSTAARFTFNLADFANTEADAHAKQAAYMYQVAGMMQRGYAFDVARGQLVD